MSKDLIINKTLGEWRAVLVENGEILDFLMERQKDSSVNHPRVGNIYYGKVLRVLPGMQSAFVDIGYEKAAFLYVDDAYLPSLEEQREMAQKRAEELKKDFEGLKNIQIDLHKNFIDVVEKSRSSKLKKDSGIELFSGEFWSGRKAKELGLVDDIGNPETILKEKFGEKIIIKRFEKTKGWLAKKLSNEIYTNQIINTLEERSIWQRYGF